MYASPPCCERRIIFFSVVFGDFRSKPHSRLRATAQDGLTGTRLFQAVSLNNRAYRRTLLLQMLLQFLFGLIL